MTPVLYIGLGSSGLRMLEEAQRFFYSTVETSCPDHVRFLFVETDQEMKPDPIPGAPPDRDAIEAFPTPLKEVGESLALLQDMVRARVFPAPNPPADSVVVMRIKDGYADRPDLSESKFPEELYRTMSHIFSGKDNRMEDRTAFDHIRKWFEEQGIKDAEISVRIKGDRLEVFAPEGLPEKFYQRLEILINDVELLTIAEKSESGTTVDQIRWLPTEDVISFADAGAGGMRSVGRIALWGESSKGSGPYLPKLRKRIKQLLQELTSKGSGSDPIVYIAGTFAGGTNSGMFIDVAYLCRDAIDPTHKKNPPILGLFLLPEVDSEDIKTVSNAYACLRDLDHFTSPDAQFLARWPLDVSVDPFPKGTTPFKMATLMSLSWAPDHELRTLYRMGGLFLFLMGSGFMGYRKARAVDVASGRQTSVASSDDAEKKNHWKYSAVGLTSVFYPRGEIRVTAACDVAESRILDAWIDEQHCLGLSEDGATIPQVYGQKESEFKTRLDKALKDSFTRLSNTGPNGKPAMASLRKYLKSVSEREVDYDEEKLRQHLDESSEIYTNSRSMVQSSNPRKLPSDRKNWTAIEVIQNEVSSMVAEAIDETSSIRYGKKVLEGIAEYLSLVTDLWESLHVTEWASALEGSSEAGRAGILSELLGGQPAIFLANKPTRTARLENALRLMYIHLMFPVVSQLREHIADDNSSNKSQRFADIPTVAEMDQLETLISDASTRITRHRRVVCEGIRENDLIKYVYPSGSFESEVETTISQLKTKHTPSQGNSLCKDLLDYRSASSTLELLRSCKGRPDKLASYAVDCVTSILQSKNVHLPEPPETPSGEHYLYQNPALGIFADKAMTDISVQMGDRGKLPKNAPTHPKVVVTSSKDEATEVLKTLKSGNITNFPDKESIEASTPDLKDMVVFFDERPVTEIQSLAALHLWKPHYNRRCLEERSVDTYFHT